MKPIEALVELVVPLGAPLRLGAPGAVASTVHEAVVASLSSESFTALTARLCGPSASELNDFGEEHVP
ncbi:MAG: hypothetical protein WCO96_09690 [Actinomycetes bacterium]